MLCCRRISSNRHPLSRYAQYTRIMVSTMISEAKQWALDYIYSFVISPNSNATRSVQGSADILPSDTGEKQPLLLPNTWTVVAIHWGTLTWLFLKTLTFQMVRNRSSLPHPQSPSTEVRCVSTQCERETACTLVLLTTWGPELIYCVPIMHRCEGWRYLKIMWVFGANTL